MRRETAARLRRERSCRFAEKRKALRRKEQALRYPPAAQTISTGRKVAEFAGRRKPGTGINRRRQFEGGCATTARASAAKPAPIRKLARAGGAARDGRAPPQSSGRMAHPTGKPSRIPGKPGTNRDVGCNPA